MQRVKHLWLIPLMPVVLFRLWLILLYNAGEIVVWKVTDTWADFCPWSEAWEFDFLR